MIKTIIESSHEHLDTYKISFLFNKPLKSYGSLYFATFSMKSICHTFASFGTTLAKLTELIFQSFCKDIILSAQFLVIFNNITTSFEPQALRTIFWSLFKYTKITPGSQKDTFVTLKLIRRLLFSAMKLEIFKVRLNDTLKSINAMKLVTQNYQKKWLFQEIPAPKNTQVQLPRWPSNLGPGIKTKFKDFSGET